MMAFDLLVTEQSCLSSTCAKPLQLQKALLFCISARCFSQSLERTQSSSRLAKYFTGRGKTWGIRYFRIVQKNWMHLMKMSHECRNLLQYLRKTNKILKNNIFPASSLHKRYCFAPEYMNINMTTVHAKYEYI